MATKKKTTSAPTSEEVRHVMSYLSSLGAAKGGHVRASRLSPERRREIARGAAAARWGTSDDEGTKKG
jgi:hypothetical protein